MMDGEYQQGAINVVEVKSAFKRYSSNNVILRGFNMTVKKGTIYALLGSSGCGKTTLLGCVTGYLNLDSGCINVALTSKQQLGYMPQELALMERFNVSEMFRYFGKINGLSLREVEERGREILQLMNLPADFYWDRIINTLSGGEKRRVSLAVAILHDPALLILDEPTVGLDPLITQRIWQFFFKATEESGKTIIITTHYIEEARNAHMVGLMRNGLLLEEKPPAQLLIDYGCETLEEVFLLLSHKQHEKEYTEEYPQKAIVNKTIKDDTLWNLNRMEAQIFKNFCWAKRNIPVLLLIIALPALLMFLFNEVYSDIFNGVHIASVSEEMLPGSCLQPDNLLNLSLPLCKPESRISCQFLRLVREQSYTIDEYKDLKSAYEAITNGQAYAILHFSSNYSSALITRLSEGLSTLDEDINQSIVGAYIDMSDLIIGHKIKKHLRDSFFDLVEDIYSDCEFNPRAAKEMIKFESPVYGKNSASFIDTAVGGFVLPLCFYVTSLFSSVSIHNEKMSGFLERCLTAGVRHTEILFAHIVIQLFIIVVQNIMLLSIAYGLYELPLKGSLSLLVFFLLLTELQGMFFGFFLGALFDQERGLSYSAVGVAMTLFLACGMMWPLEGAHWLIQKIQRHFPPTMAARSYQDIALKGWGLENPYILKSAATNTIVTLILVAMYITLCKAKK